MLAPGLALTVALLACSSLKEAAGPPGEGSDAGDSSDPEVADGGGETSAGDGGGKGSKDGGTASDATSGPEAGPAPCTFDTCTLETMLDNLYGPVSIASSGQYLYFVEVGDNIPQAGGEGWLSRVPTDKSCTMRSCFDVIEPYVLSGELQGQYIYETHVGLGPNDVCLTQSYNADPGHSIACYDLVNFKKRSLEGGGGFVVDLWVGASDARWAMGSTTQTSPDGEVRGRPLSGGTVAPLATGRVNVTSVTSDGTSTYFTEHGATASAGVVATFAADGGVVPLATGRSTPTAVASYGGYLYWAETAERKIVRTKGDGSGSVEQIANTDEKPFALAVDASGVYWACVGPGASGVEGSVAHTTLTPNGPVDVMMKHLQLVYDLAVDATHVYAATVGAQIEDGKIVRIPKTR